MAKCNCVNVNIGEYTNQVVIVIPDSVKIYINDITNSIRRKVGIDKCIAYEIISLWDRGISTTGCCCGHNKKNGYIEIGVKYQV